MCNLLYISDRGYQNSEGKIMNPSFMSLNLNFDSFEKAYWLFKHGTRGLAAVFVTPYQV